MLKSAQITKKDQCFTLFKVFKRAHKKNNIFACILINQAFSLNYVHKKIKKYQYLHNLNKIIILKVFI